MKNRAKVVKNAKILVGAGRGAAPWKGGVSPTMERGRCPMEKKKKKPPSSATRFPNNGKGRFPTMEGGRCPIEWVAPLLGKRPGLRPRADNGKTPRAKPQGKNGKNASGYAPGQQWEKRLGLRPRATMGKTPQATPQGNNGNSDTTGHRRTTNILTARSLRFPKWYFFSDM